MLFGIPDGSIDFLLRQATGGRNLNRLFLTGGNILGRHIHDSVGINIKSNFDLRNAPGCGRNPHQLEPAQCFIMSGHFPFTLENMDGHRRLIVGRRGKGLAFFGGNGGIFFNQSCHHTAQRFDPQR